MIRDDKLCPVIETVLSVAPIVFHSVRATAVQRNTKKGRQCYKCMGKITVDEQYVVHHFRYSKTIKVIYFHKNCFFK